MLFICFEMANMKYLSLYGKILDEGQIEHIQISTLT